MSKLNGDKELQLVATNTHFNLAKIMTGVRNNRY